MGRDDETEVPPNHDPANLETRIADSDDSAEGAESGAVDPELAAREAASIAETVVSPQDPPDEAATVLASPAESSDPSESSGVAQAAPTRVVASSDADASPAGAIAAAGVSTRVLNSADDKTPPPPMAGSAAAPSPADVETVVEPPGGASAGEVDRGLVPGTILFGEYEIVSVLGVGGMGEVYRARHRRLDEFRAIKVMHAELAKKPQAAEFFYREAKALLAVRHPAVVHCHDLLSDDAGRVYLVMEMIEGVPLSKKMNEGPLSADDVAILGARVSQGLSAAHRKGVIHRDVSPDNIVLPNGRVQEAKIIDFGIAKILEEGEGTILDGFKGKLSYASPEQLGFFGGKIDGRSDFYCLGLVLVAAALGKPMGMGTTVMEAVDARRGFETLPDEIPIGLRSAIQPLLALDPKDRPRYVDRLFVVPGGLETTEPGGYSSRSADYAAHGALAAPARSTASSPVGKIVVAVAAGLLLLAGGGYWLSTSGATFGPASETLQETSAGTPLAVDGGAVVPAPPSTEIDGAPVEEIEDPAPVVAKLPAKPVVKRLSASDRIKIIGLVNNAKLALGENRLMTPPGDNAYDLYQKVLALDPKNAKARDGLRSIADRYVSLAESAVAAGEVDRARDLLSRARKADPRHPRIQVLAARISG